MKAERLCPLRLLFGYIGNCFQRETVSDVSKMAKGTVEMMNERTKPMLSIGMIVKNEQDKLEKCLQALQPLRDAVACELVIADTGSTDNTRAIAEKYADLVFDFPWVNDFSAARNAVMDRCNGVWYLTVDADEYLDPDITELVAFLNGKDVEKADIGYVIQRNYNTAEMVSGDYNDFFACRMVRMATGRRYAGTIHETFASSKDRTPHFFRHLVFHHDGYAWKNEADAQSKMQRNLTLLEKELEQHPNNARILLECIESSNFQPEKRNIYAHKAMNLLQSGGNVDEPIFAAPLARDACLVAVEERLPEADFWLSWTKKQFADSVFTHIDVTYALALLAHHEQRYDAVIQAAERYFAEIARFAKSSDQRELAISSLQRMTISNQRIMQLISAEAYVKLGQKENAWRQVSNWDIHGISAEVISDWVRVMTLFSGLPEAEIEVLRVFQATASEDAETESKLRHAYVSALLNLLWNERNGVGVYRRLPGILGICAAFLVETDSAVRAALLEYVTDWSEYPVPLAQAAIRAQIPLPNRFFQQPAEKLHDIIILLLQQSSHFAEQAIWQTKQAADKSLSELWFAFEMVSIALQTQKEMDASIYKKLISCFRQLADRYLHQWYNSDLLKDETKIHLLPNLHRFAWYFLRSQERLDQRDVSGCIRDLRIALEQGPNMKDMVVFLLDCIEKGDYPTAIAVASPELLELSDKVKAILSAYAPDDPMVQEIKQSEVYRKVSYLIEDSDSQWIL